MLYSINPWTESYVNLLTYLGPSLQVEHRPLTTALHWTLTWESYVKDGQIYPYFIWPFSAINLKAYTLKAFFDTFLLLLLIKWHFINLPYNKELYLAILGMDH